MSHTSTPRYRAMLMPGYKDTWEIQRRTIFRWVYVRRFNVNGDAAREEVQRQVDAHEYPLYVYPSVKP